MSKIRSSSPNRVASVWNLATRVASGTLTAAPGGPGVVGSIVHMGGAVTNLGVFDNTAASGTNIAYILGASAGQEYNLDAPFTVGLSVFASGASNIGVKYIYD